MRTNHKIRSETPCLSTARLSSSMGIARKPATGFCPRGGSKMKIHHDAVVREEALNELFGRSGISKQLDIGDWGNQHGALLFRNP